jgi:hypothetical protein
MSCSTEMSCSRELCLVQPSYVLLKRVLSCSSELSCSTEMSCSSEFHLLKPSFVLFKRVMSFRFVFWDVLPYKLIVDRHLRGTFCLHHQGDETSVDNYFTRQYIPEDKSELNTRRRENLKSHGVMSCSTEMSCSSELCLVQPSYV